MGVEDNFEIVEFLNRSRLSSQQVLWQLSTSMGMSMGMVVWAASAAVAADCPVGEHEVALQPEQESVGEATLREAWPIALAMNASSLLPMSPQPEPLTVEFGQATTDAQSDVAVQADVAVQLCVATDAEQPVQLPQEGELSQDIVAAGAINASYEDKAQLFEEIFGTSSSLQSAILPWSINGLSQGDLPVKINLQTEDMHWPMAGFTQALGEKLREELLETVYDMAENGSLSRNRLAQAGIETQFDVSTLQLNVVLAPEQLRPNVVTFKDAKQAEEAPTVAVAKLSGYLNTRGSVGWTWLPETGEQAGIQPVALQWDGALNYRGWVLESGARFLEDSATPWQRQDVRLVHDRPELAVRFKAGEISSPITGYQRGASILGVSATRQFGLQPDLVTRPVSNYEFFLEAPGKVEVFINGDRDRVLDLPAGTQDLRDLSLGAGINDIELLITDPVGRERRLQFFSPVATQLLSPGLQQFAYSLGVPLEQKAGVRSYDFANPLLSASHRWGVTSTLTAGTYLQANPSQQMLGAEGKIATTWGSWDWDAAMSLDGDVGLGYGAQLGYEYRRSGDPQQRSLRLGGSYRNDSFLSVGEAAPDNRIPLEANLSYRQKLFARVNTNLSGRYQWTEDGNAYRVSLNVSRPIGRGRSLGVNFSHAQKADGETDQQMRINFLASMPKRRQTLNATTESNLAGDVTRKLAWNYRDRANVFNTGLNVSENGETWDLDHQLNWRGYRATLGLKTDATGNRNTAILDWSGMESQLSFGTGLVFADGRFGWSKPVEGSFALLVPHQQLRGQGIEVNPSSRRAAAVIDRWGAAVLSGLSDYKLNEINLDAPSLPLGYSLGQNSHRLKPGYRQGTLVMVGNDATVFLRGVLKLADGTVSELKVGEVRSLDDADWAVQTLFTNRVGKFALEGFKPGNYQIRLTEGETVDFTIPEDATGMFDIGVLQLKAVQSATSQ